MKRILIIVLVSIFTSCSYSPILDENDKYINSSQEDIDTDIDNCTKRADNHLEGLKMKRAGKVAARQSVAGAFFGAIIGLFTGDIDQVVKSAATGAAVGGVVGAGSVAGEGSISPDKIKQRYVNNCLSRRGYVVLGWQ